MNESYTLFRKLTDEVPKLRDRILRDIMIAATKHQNTDGFMKALDDLNWLERKDLGRAVEAFRLPVKKKKVPW